MGQPHLSIIIVNWNTRELLGKCLASLVDDRNNATVEKTEIVVVDNGSTDGSQKMVTNRFAGVRLLENETNAGFARANNQGIEEATGDYLLLLNSDTEVHPGALQTLLAFMETHSRAGAAGARLLNADGTLQPSCHPMLTPEREFWRLMFLDRLAARATYDLTTWDTGRPRQVEAIKGACLMLRREALDEVGLLDESYFMYTEEVDLCYRLTQAGWELWWVPQAKVTHYGGASSRQEAEDMYMELYRSKVHFYRKFGGEPRAKRFKRLVRLAYWPRLAITLLGAPFSHNWRRQARTQRRLLRELPAM